MAMKCEYFPAFNHNNVPVVLSANNFFAPYAGVFIQSLLNHASTDKNYDIIIFERNISAENKRLLKGFENKRENISVRFYNPSPYFENLNLEIMEKVLPIETFFDIVAPYALIHYEKILVIDCDTLLRSDVADLYEMDLDSLCIGGVGDVVLHGYYKSNRVFEKEHTDMQTYFKEVVPLKDPYQYINAGVLLFDCEQYRNAFSVEKIQELAQKGFMFCDQDILNLLFQGKIKHLDAAWNAFVPANMSIQAGISQAPEESKRIYEQAYRQPLLLHWAAKPKPWVCPDLDYGNEWWQTAMETPFVGHIIARMIDELTDRRKYYEERYGQSVAAWPPIPPNIVRNRGKLR